MLVVAVFFEDIALGVGVAGDVEPVAGPSLAEVRRGQQPIDGGLVPGIAGVGGEIGQLFGRRRQADEIVVQSAQKRVRGSAWGDGVKPAASSFATTKWSKSDRAARLRS